MATVEAEIQCYRYRGMGIKLTLEQQADGGLSWFGLLRFEDAPEGFSVCSLWSSEWCYEWLNNSSKIENSQKRVVSSKKMNECSSE